MKDMLKEYQLFLGTKYRKPNTQVRYLNAAEKLVGYIKELTKEEIQRYVIHLNKTQKQNAVVSNIVGLNRFLVYLKREDLRVSTPSWKPITRDVIKREQIVQLLEHAKSTYMFMDYLILLMVRDLDCRNHEIIETRWDWIHGDKILFKDCKTGDTTGRLTKELHDALEHWQKVTPYPNQPYVFVIPYGPFKGRPMSRTGWYIRSLVNRISLEVIGRKLNPQDLRASVITAEYTAYVNPKIIQLKARHRSEKTTLRYNHVDEEMVAAYMEQGTIFVNNKKPVLIAKPEVCDGDSSKRGCINRFSVTQDSLKQEDQDNSSFCFSITFFVYELSGAWDLNVFSSHDYHFHTSQIIAHAPVLFIASSFVFVLSSTNAETKGVFSKDFSIIYPPSESDIPGFCLVQPRAYCDGATPRCGMTSGERDWWGRRSNFGQVKAPESQVWCGEKNG